MISNSAGISISKLSFGSEVGKYLSGTGSFESVYDKINDGYITNAKINASALIDLSKLEATGSKLTLVGANKADSSLSKKEFTIASDAIIYGKYTNAST